MPVVCSHFTTIGVILLPLLILIAVGLLLLTPFILLLKLVF